MVSAVHEDEESKGRDLTCRGRGESGSLQLSACYSRAQEQDLGIMRIQQYSTPSLQLKPVTMRKSSNSPVSIASLKLPHSRLLSIIDPTIRSLIHTLQ